MTSDWTKRIRLRNLEIILALATNGNISLTADVLNMTQPGVSRWLKELEEDIGLKLFERHSRGLRPTEHGQILIDHARKILNQLDFIRDDLKARRNDGSGMVRLGCSGATTTNIAPAAIRALTQKWPNVQVSVLEGTMDSLLDHLQAGSLDIVIGRSTKRLLAEPIEFETLYIEPLHFVASARHPLSQRKQVHWRDIYQFRWIVWPEHTPIREDLEMALLMDKKALPDIYIESNSSNFNINLLEQTDYIGIASSRTAHRWQQLGLLRILNLPLAGLGSVSVFWHKDSLSRHAVQATLQAIRDNAQML